MLLVKVSSSQHSSERASFFSMYCYVTLWVKILRRPYLVATLYGLRACRIKLPKQNQLNAPSCSINCSGRKSKHRPTYVFQKKNLNSTENSSITSRSTTVPNRSTTSPALWYLYPGTGGKKRDLTLNTWVGQCPHY